MALLSVEDVTKRYRHGRREFLALRSVSIEAEVGELTVVLGARKSGRSTLLRIAAGLEHPDSGRVLLDGQDLARTRRVLGRDIAFSYPSFPAAEGERVIDHVALPLLARRGTKREARRAAEKALERASALTCAAMEPRELNAVERLRVAIARGIVGGPRLLITDDADAGAGPAQAGALFTLLASLVHDDGLAVLISTADATRTAGAERVYRLDGGAIRGEVQAPTAQIISLRQTRASN
jgi:ABC-type lipoprotein export system ATPase subunit